MSAANQTRANFTRAAAKIANIPEITRPEAARYLRQVGEEIMADAKNSKPGRGVPVDTGALRASGQVEGPDLKVMARVSPSLVSTITGRARGVFGAVKIRVMLAFGDAATQYALVQHERLDYHHEIGEARYLVRAVDRHLPDRSRSLAGFKRNVRRALRALGRLR